MAKNWKKVEKRWHVVWERVMSLVEVRAEVQKKEGKATNVSDRIE